MRAKQIGQSAEYNMLYEIYRKINRINQLAPHIGWNNGPTTPLNEQIFQQFEARVTADGGIVEAEQCFLDRVQSLIDSGIWSKTSAVWLPHGYKEDKLYAVKGGADADLGFTRAGTRSRKGPTYIERVPYNHLSHTESFSNGAWIKSSVTIEENTITAPDGTTTGCNVYPSSTGTFRSINQEIATHAAGQICTQTVYAKANGKQWIWMANIGSGIRGYFDVLNGVAGTLSGGFTGSIEASTNGWWKITFTGPTQSAAGGDFFIGICDGDSNNTATTSGTNGVAIWHPQLVNGSVARDYFATTDRFNVPAIDYTNDTCPALSLEPARTNLLLRSEEFDNASWTKVGSTISANNTTAPDGLSTADKIVEDGNLSAHGFNFTNTSSLSAPNTYTFSIYIKAAGRTWCSVEMQQAASTLRGVFIDLTNGVFGSDYASGAFTNKSIANIGDGWFRVSVSYDKTNTSADFIKAVYSATADGTSRGSYTGDSSSGIYAWGAQLEAGPYATSYIPTTTATVSRILDQVDLLTGVTSIIPQSEGAIFVDFTIWDLGGAFTFPLCIGDNTTNNVVSFFMNSAGTFQGSFVVGGSAQTVINQASLSGSRVKALIRFSNSERAGFFNGIKQTTNSNLITVPAMDRLGIMLRNTGLNRGYGNVNSALLINGPVSDAQAIALTTA